MIFNGTFEEQKDAKFKRLAAKMRVSHLFMRLLIQNTKQNLMTIGSQPFHMIVKDFAEHAELSYGKYKSKLQGSRGQKDLKRLKDNFPSSFFQEFDNYKYFKDEQI